MHVYRMLGEGTQHVLKVAVTGAPSDIFARDLGRFVTNSNLVKCAMAGCDPNVGRIVGTSLNLLEHFHFLLSVMNELSN